MLCYLDFPRVAVGLDVGLDDSRYGDDRDRGRDGDRGRDYEYDANREPWLGERGD